jgi:putative oxidoreductase
VQFTVPKVVADLSLLLIRLVVGLSFIVASKNKSKNIRKFAKANDLPVLVAMGVMTTEFIAGSALLLGIFPQIAGLVLILLMLGTLRLHIFKWKSPYWAASGGWEYDLMLLAMSLVIVIHGGGRFTLLSKI